MLLNLANIVLKDFVYKQNPDGSYILDTNGNLISENVNDIIDTIRSKLKDTYIAIIRSKNVDPGEIRCNDYLLEQSLSRYSRDIFGVLRLDAKIGYLTKNGKITETQLKNLSEVSDYGLKVESRDPYIHRQISDLLYWLAVLKPFAIYPKSNEIIKTLGLVFEFHNEYISYLLSLMMLKVFNVTLNIHKDKDIFHDFLYDLHYRNLSRSSLEFFLDTHIKPIE